MNLKKVLSTTSYLEVDCRHILTMALHCGEGLIANISLLRTSKQKDFDEDDERLARMTALCLGGTAQRLAMPTRQRDSSIILMFDRQLSPKRIAVGSAWEGLLHFLPRHGR